MTTYTDKTLTCVECKTSFIFSARDQEFHASKGFANEPKRCPSCRQARKVQRGEAAPAAAGVGRSNGPAVYSGPRAQGTSARPQGNFGNRPRGRRNDGERGGRDGGADTSARSFDGGNAPAKGYTANCMACGNETPASADAGNRVIFCAECYEKMAAIARS